MSFPATTTGRFHSFFPRGPHDAVRNLAGFQPNPAEGAAHIENSRNSSVPTFYTAIRVLESRAIKILPYCLIGNVKDPREG
jgi:hypothetical protein